MENCSSRHSEKHADGFRRTPLIADSSLRRGISSVIWLYYKFHSIGILLSVLQCHACSVTWHTPTLAQPAENLQKHADAERDAGRTEEIEVIGCETSRYALLFVNKMT